MYRRSILRTNLTSTSTFMPSAARDVAAARPAVWRMGVCGGSESVPVLSHRARSRRWRLPGPVMGTHTGGVRRMGECACRPAPYHQTVDLFCRSQLNCMARGQCRPKRQMSRCRPNKSMEDAVEADKHALAGSNLRTITKTFGDRVRLGKTVAPYRVSNPPALVRVEVQ